MPGCAAIGCSNSAAKGFFMKRFPRDPVRRKLWASKMFRDKWQPTDNSVLCETHFEADMWEKVRVDGTKKLKLHAVPTLFAFKKPVIHRKPPAIRKTVVGKELLPGTYDSDPSSINFDTQIIGEEIQTADRYSKNT